MYKHLVQQIVQRKVQQKVHNNCVAPLIKQSVFTKLVESFFVWILNWGCKLYFLPVKQNQNKENSIIQ